MNGALLASRCQGRAVPAFGHRAPAVALMRGPRLPALAARPAAPARLPTPVSRSTSSPLRAASTGSSGGPGAAEAAAAVEARLQHQKNELQSMVLSIPYKKIALWGMVFGVAYQLHEFFGVRARAGIEQREASAASAAARGGSLAAAQEIACMHCMHTLAHSTPLSLLEGGTR
jgi:hypothetical protein